MKSHGVKLFIANDENLDYYVLKGLEKSLFNKK